MNDRASTHYPTQSDIDAGTSADALSVLDGSARAVVLNGDCLTRLRALPDGSVDACVCDPPYGLSQREPEMADVLARWVEGERYEHGAGGFQGAEWDAFVPGPEVWREVYRVLKPGGYLLAFGAPRRYDLLCLAIRLAGFTVRDSLHWVYANGNGGTKSHNLSLAIDKAAGAKRKVVGSKKTNVGLRGGNYGRGSRNEHVAVTEPATAAAKQWEGWGTSVAPAHEPIVVAQKPVDGTYVGNLLEHGVGGLNIDGCKSGGRWPKNILFGHGTECTDNACAPGCPVAELDAQHTSGLSDKFPVFRPDSPFQYCAKPSRAERNAGLDASFSERRSDTRTGAAAGIWVEKGGATQRNHHPTAKPVALMAWLCRLVTPRGGVVLDPFAGSGSTGCGAVGEELRFIGVELSDEYAAIARARINHLLPPAPAAQTSPPRRRAASPASPATLAARATSAPRRKPQPRLPKVALPLLQPTGQHSVARATTSAGQPASLAIAASKSQNRKLGNAATTYVAQVSCPKSCPLYDGGGCYAESGRVGLVTNQLNEAAKARGGGPREAALDEAAKIDAIKVKPGRPLRLHTVGDCSTDEAAGIVAAAAVRYRERGGGPVWTYTHAWREVARSSWGEVSVFASCENAADVGEARARGYASVLVVEDFETDARHVIDDNGGSQAGADILPCPQQTRDKTCSECRLCFNDRGVFERGYSIGFKVHGSPATVKRARKALRDPNDPDRKLSSRVLIPRFVAGFTAQHGREPRNSEIAAALGITPSSVSAMRRQLAREAAAPDVDPLTCPSTGP